jgi:hypothetical protein
MPPLWKRFPELIALIVSMAALIALIVLIALMATKLLVYSSLAALVAPVPSLIVALEKKPADATSISTTQMDQCKLVNGSRQHPSFDQV